MKKRYNKKRKRGESVFIILISSQEKKPVKVPPEVEQWKKQRSDHQKLWPSLVAAIKGSAIDPISLNCFLPPEQLLLTAVKSVEGDTLQI